MAKLSLWLVMIGFVFGLATGILSLLADFILAILPAVLIIISIAFIGFMTFAIARRIRKKKKQIPANLTKLIKKTNGATASTKEDLDDFLSRNILVRSFHTRVVGVTYDNDDGTSRQEVLSHCLRGDPVGFYWHDFCGRPACAVISDHGQIGYLSADLAEDLHYDYASDRYSMVAHISDITGGQDGLSYGCNILLSIYETI